MVMVVVMLVVVEKSQCKRCIDDTDANENSSQRKGSKRTCIGCDQIANDISEFGESPRSS
jgi:NAD-dependent SIR2 family protein deacetylase